MLRNIDRMDFQFAKRYSNLAKPGSELTMLRERSTEDIAHALQSMSKAIVLKDERGTDLAEAKLANLMGETMTLSNLMGRRRLLMEMPNGVEFTESDEALLFANTPIFPRIPFREALAYLKGLTPKIAKSAQEVSEMYREGTNFSVARTARQTILERIKRYIEASVAGNSPREQAIQAIKKAGSFSRGYAKTIYSTNLTSAYTAGRFQQAKEPSTSKVIKGFQYVAINDPPRVRENHFAHNGFFASQFDPAWNEFAPPQGFSCRCGVRLVTIFEARRRGLLDDSGNISKMSEAEKQSWRSRGAVPDKGFNPTADRVMSQ